MSKQLSLSAAVSAFAMAVFVLLATPNRTPEYETDAMAEAFAPAFEALLPTP